jgi:UDP-glucose 4-epimerase
LANYLVKGGAGFIGSHLSEALVKRGHRVRVADNFVTGYRQNLRQGVEFMEGDCADPAFAQQIVSGIDYVLHQAAIPSVPRSVDKPLESHRANVDGMLQMLIASRDAGVKRLVFAGSSSVYGNTEILPKTETMPTNPMSPHALQKMMGECTGRCSRASTDLRR